jgi:hypothetical protein
VNTSPVLNWDFIAPRHFYVSVLPLPQNTSRSWPTDAPSAARRTLACLRDQPRGDGCGFQAEFDGDAQVRIGSHHSGTSVGDAPQLAGSSTGRSPSARQSLASEMPAPSERLVGRQRHGKMEGHKKRAAKKIEIRRLERLEVAGILF